MDKSEFDKFAEEYRDLHQNNISVSGESPDFFSRYKIKDTAEIVAEIKLNNRLNILDFGSGVGNSVPFINEYFPESKITCLDVSSKSLAIAEQRFPGNADYVLFDGNKIPSENNRFDLVFSACVFHHIPHIEHIPVLQEIYRVLKPGGIMVIFEHNPLNPLTRYAVNTCPFDENATLITASEFLKRIRHSGFFFFFLKPKKSYRIFFPGLLRKLRPMEKFLKWLPLGAQYYVLAQKDSMAE